jgi:Transposase Tn5 dimerisation domain
MERARSLGWHCLIRAWHNRKVVDSEGASDRLFDHVRSLTALCATGIHLRSRPGYPARDVRLNVAWAPLAVEKPFPGKGESVNVWCIRAWEDTPGGLEWVLLSSVEVQNERDALEKLEWYRRRWLVEEYHKCLKTGCSMEDRQSRTRHALEAVLGLLSIVAVFLLQLKFAEEGEVPDSLRMALSALSKRDLVKATPREVLREIAKLGGFLARKGDGEPGWQTIWAGWNRLQDILLGIQLVLGEKCV